MGQKPRRPPQNVPDSLPQRDEGTDVAPDRVRDTESPPSVPPDSLPDEEKEARDGGVAQHPIHDSDQEDRDPQDFERDVDREGTAPVDTALRRQG